MSNHLYPDSQIYIIFGICIAILSIVAGLSKDRVDLGISENLVPLIVLVPLFHIIYSVVEKMDESGYSVDRIWHLGSIVIIYFLIHHTGKVLGDIVKQNAKKSFVPSSSKEEIPD